MLRSSALVLTVSLIALPARAQDLTTALEVWSFTEGGEDGNDRNDAAQGIAVDSQGNYVAVGYQDGQLDHGKNAFVRKYDNMGGLIWEQIDDRGALDPYKTWADDIYWDVAVDNADQICLVGEVSGDTTTGWDSGYYIAKLFDYDGTVDWDDTWQDGGASTSQAGFGVDLDSNQDVVAAGWSFRHPNQMGQWASFRYITTTGLRDLGPLYYDFGADFDALDQAFDVAVDSQGDIIVVGAIGNDGATGPDDANRDWHVRKYAGAATGTGTTGVLAGDLLWEHTWAGIAGLDDVARGVAIDASDEIIVVGYTNNGTDNGANADFDWLIIKYDSAGGAGLGNTLFETTWSDPTNPGAKEMAHDVHIGDNGMDFVVGGTWDDAGDAAWRVGLHGWFDGAELSGWSWPAAAGGDSVLHSIDVLDGRVVAAGSVWNGYDQDIQYTLLDQDDDGDGVGDSVDGCPFDATKIEPGICGCGNPDIDSDYDGFLDCDDACPDLAEKWLDEGVCGCDEPDEDRDGDGTEDCIDNCPDDPNKTSLQVCGCGVPDDDSDGDGVLGCDDACSQTPAGTPVDEAGCPVEDCTDGVDNNNNTKVDCDDEDCVADPACATAGDGDGDSKGCGCTSTPASPAGLLALGLTALVVRRRR